MRVNEVLIVNITVSLIAFKCHLTFRTNSRGTRVRFWVLIWTEFILPVTFNTYLYYCVGSSLWEIFVVRQNIQTFTVSMVWSQGLYHYICMCVFPVWHECLHQGKEIHKAVFSTISPHCWSPSGAPSVSSEYLRLHINLESRNTIIVVPLKKKTVYLKLTMDFLPTLTAPHPSLPGSSPRGLYSVPAPALLRGRRSRCLIGLDSASLCPLTSLMLVGCFLLPPFVRSSGPTDETCRIGTSQLCADTANRVKQIVI